MIFGLDMEALFHDKDEIIRELRKDPLIIKDDNHIINGKELQQESSDLLQQEAQLANELNTLDNLKILSNLLTEVKTNLELLELENCYYSLQSLRQKMRNNTAFLKQSFNFQQSISLYVDSLHLKLVTELYEILTTGFWRITENTIQFTPTVKWGKDEVDIEYNTFMGFVTQQYFPQGGLDSQSWIISDMDNADSQEQVRAKLNVILKDYVNLASVVNKIRSSIFIPGKQISHDDEKKMLNFSKSASHGQNTTTVLASFETVCDFILHGLALRDMRTLSSELGHLFNTEFTKFVKNNASIILDSLDSPLKTLVSSANDKLIKLASETKTENWFYSGKEIQDLLMNKQLYYNLLLDKILESHINNIRDIFEDPNKSWKTLETIELKHARSSTNTTSENKGNSGMDTKQEKKEHHTSAPKDDDWNWEADDDADAWGEEIDVDIDDEEEKPAELMEEEPDEEEEGENAWDEAWAIDEDENVSDFSSVSKIKPSKVHNITLNEDRIEVTQLPNLFLTISQNFKNSFEDSHVDKQYFAYKYNLLQTSYMAMCTNNLFNNWYQLYVDMRYLIEQDEKLYRIKELTRNLLETRLNMKYRFVSRLIERQLTEFREKEKNPSWDAIIESLLPYISKEIIYPLEKIKGEESYRYLLSFLNFLYNDCVTNKILKWKIISEVNSENLGELVSLLVNNTEIQTLAEEPGYKAMREKFATMGKFLPLHLKEIMEMFYNGDFYLFTTDELIQWIELLFADTPLRRNAIDDIHEIRDAGLED
ncbi:hypothetical protein SEUBUCD646_0N00760 [Saccharomyces eubayanus]|uniref:Protein transport protein dsl1 n=2 Tax=Saccharomyces TaxID=4930 RepID=A0A6C1EEM3_SACPS|nr:protein transport protein dsl1 [Saccharomyces pastorianus]CAI1668443.1 hypothetical protein SEUBUCD650_0N00760 [Saccharomyces eubayanus]CAI1699036.1 hypothetical protein SEUBUCD646_0N00760 [Saccharomyces eubayanus]